jgi:hypothetical protein
VEKERLFQDFIILKISFLVWCFIFCIFSHNSQKNSLFSFLGKYSSLFCGSGISIILAFGFIEFKYFMYSSKFQFFQVIPIISAIFS